MAKRTWFSMKAAADGASADIAIYDVVGYFGVDAGSFRAELDALPSTVSTINLRLNSPGGDVYQGVAIHNMLDRHPADVIVTVDGMAASIASLIAMVGKQILMPENSAMLIHNPSGGAYGTADDMDQMAQWLRSIGQGVTNTYVSANRVGLPRADIEGMLAAETWMTAQEAVEKGFADKVLAPAALTMKFDLEAMGFEKTPKAFMRQVDPPVAAKWVAALPSALLHYRVDEPTDFSAEAAATSILEFAGFKAGSTPEPAKAAPGFLFLNETAPALAASYRFPLATMVDGAMRVTGAALTAAEVALAACADIGDPEKTAAGATIAGHRQALAILRANAPPSDAATAAAKLAVEAAATRSKEILAACEVAGVSAKQAREFVDGGKSLDEVRAALLALGTGGPRRDELNPHNTGGGGGNDTAPEAGWQKAVDRFNAQRMPRQRAHA